MTCEVRRVGIEPTTYRINQDGERPEDGVGPSVGEGESALPAPKTVQIVLDDRNVTAIPGYRPAAYRRPPYVPPRPLADRFWEKVEMGPASACWPWTASRMAKGYGRILIADRVRAAHRVAWELACGPIPAGLCVCHHCDNPACCNPSHLWLGTNTENQRDMIAKGRDAASFSGRNRIKTHCKSGHEFTPENTIYYAGGKRRCRQCGYRWWREWNLRRRGVA